MWSGSVRTHCDSQHPSDGTVLAETQACGKHQFIDATLGSLPETQRTVTMPPITGSEGKHVAVLIKSLPWKDTTFHSYLSGQNQSHSSTGPEKARSDPSICPSQYPCSSDLTAGRQQCVLTHLTPGLGLKCNPICTGWETRQRS